MHTVPISFVEIVVFTKVMGMLVLSALPTKDVGMQAVYQNSQIQEWNGPSIHFVEYMKTLATQCLWNRGLWLHVASIKKIPWIKGHDHTSVKEAEKVQDLVFSKNSWTLFELSLSVPSLMLNFVVGSTSYPKHKTTQVLFFILSLEFDKSSDV